MAFQMKLCLKIVFDLQAALKLSGQTEATLQKELQQCRSSANSQCAVASQAAAAAQA